MTKVVTAVHKIDYVENGENVSRTPGETFVAPAADYDYLYAARAIREPGDADLAFFKLAQSERVDAEPAPVKKGATKKVAAETSGDDSADKDDIV